MATPNWSMVVITAVDGTLRRASDGSIGEARAAVEALTAGGIPIVLTSEAPASEVRQLQQELGIAAPFVCHGGGEVHIPPGYFVDTPARPDDEWEVIRFPPRRASSARDDAPGLRMLVSLFRSWSPGVLVVGLGSEWNDRSVLRSADVPIVVRNAEANQHRLLRSITKDALHTTEHGPAGWAEAILGQPRA